MKQQTVGKQSILQLGLVLVAGVMFVLAVIVPGYAAASTQGFNLLSGQPQAGMLVSLTANPGVIEPANDKNATSLVGVIAPGETSLDQKAGQVSVKTDGVANALVSTLNGDIRVGDRITASPLEGVGAKTKNDTWIVGIAQASLDAHSKSAVSTTISDSKGSKHTVYVTSMPVLVKVTYFSSGSPGSSVVPTTNNHLPDSLQKIVDNIAGKHVSTIALVLSFLLFLTGVISAVVVINSSIRGGFTAISRQPLSKNVILREVWRSFGAAMFILLFVMLASVFLLRIL